MSKKRAHGEGIIRQLKSEEKKRPAVPNLQTLPDERFHRYKVNLRVSTQSSYVYTLVKFHAHGVDMSTIKALAGHSGRNVTEGYTHLSGELLSKAANRLNDLFGLVSSA